MKRPRADAPQYMFLGRIRYNIIQLNAAVHHASCISTDFVGARTEISGFSHDVAYPTGLLNSLDQDPSHVYDNFMTIARTSGYYLGLARNKYQVLSFPPLGGVLPSCSLTFSIIYSIKAEQVNEETTSVERSQSNSAECASRRYPGRQNA